jgi:triacylglycerol lipase
MRLVAIGLVVAVGLLGTACDWRGPEPTDQLLLGNGAFGIGTVAVPTSAGFGGGTIYYPTGNPGPFAVISFSPGFLEQSGAFSLWGEKLASHGFVAILFNTSSTSESPDTRSTEQRQALNYVVAQGQNASSPIFGLVDGNRRAVMGHSMGGGASLISAQADHSIDAVVPLAPWNSSTNFSGDTSPTLIVACQNDNIAPVNSHASPFYNSIPATTKKEYVSVTGGDHFCANGPALVGGGNVGKYAVAFLKRWLDTDTRYDPWTCGANKAAAGSVFNEVRSTCPW